MHTGFERCISHEIEHFGSQSVEVKCTRNCKNNLKTFTDVFLHDPVQVIARVYSSSQYSWGYKFELKIKWKTNIFQRVNKFGEFM